MATRHQDGMRWADDAEMFLDDLAADVLDELDAAAPPLPARAAAVRRQARRQAFKPRGPTPEQKRAEEQRRRAEDAKRRRKAAEAKFRKLYAPGCNPNDLKMPKVRRCYDKFILSDKPSVSGDYNFVRCGPRGRKECCEVRHARPNDRNPITICEDLGMDLEDI